MKYAVIDFGGQQYKVSEGDELAIQVGKTSDKMLDFDKVLLLVDGDRVFVGNPNVSGAKVSAEVLGSLKGEKITVRKYKAKSRYRKTKGFRPIFTKIKIKKILSV